MRGKRRKSSEKYIVRTYRKLEDLSEYDALIDKIRKLIFQKFVSA